MRIKMHAFSYALPFCLVGILIFQVDAAVKKPGPAKPGPGNATVAQNVTTKAVPRPNNATSQRKLPPRPNTTRSTPPHPIVLATNKTAAAKNTSNSNITKTQQPPAPSKPTRPTVKPVNMTSINSSASNIINVTTTTITTSSLLSSTEPPSFNPLPINANETGSSPTYEVPNQTQVPGAGAPVPNEPEQNDNNSDSEESEEEIPETITSPFGGTTDAVSTSSPEHDEGSFQHPTPDPHAFGNPEPTRIPDESNNVGPQDAVSTSSPEQDEGSFQNPTPDPHAFGNPEPTRIPDEFNNFGPQGPSAAAGSATRCIVDEDCRKGLVIDSLWITWGCKCGPLQTCQLIGHPRWPAAVKQCADS